MGYYSGPRIITNGLVLHLDAANKKSYPGTGTTWFDLSGNNNHGTLTNGPTYSSVNGGVIVFDGVNDYSNINTSITSAFSEMTVEIVYQTSDPGNSGNAYLLWDHNGATGCPMWLGKTQSNTWYFMWNYNSAVGKTAYLSSTSYAANTWVHLAVRLYLSQTQTLESGNFAEIVVNGSSYSTTHRNDKTSSLVYPQPPLYLAKKGSAISNGELGATVADYSNIKIGLFRIYNKVLSRSDIQQNFNAVRSRYGL